MSHQTARGDVDPARLQPCLRYSRRDALPSLGGSFRLAADGHGGDGCGLLEIDERDVLLSRRS